MEANNRSRFYQAIQIDHSSILLNHNSEQHNKLIAA